MTTPDRKSFSAPVAAAIILLVVGAGFYFLPTVMLALGDISPWLAAVVGAAFVLGFFLIFWLRARYQRRNG